MEATETNHSLKKSTLRVKTVQKEVKISGMP